MTTKPDRPLLALCMIVRDASETIDDLLESVKGAFDEYVFVDTGSVDDTREKINDFFHFGWWPNEEARANSLRTEFDNAAVVRANFKWIDDFAAARNYSFGLATATWRMFLDADDVFPNAQHLREYVSKLPAHINAVSMKYVYAKGLSEQDKIRLVRWLDDNGNPTGYRWEDELHEYLTCAPNPRMISKAAAYEVLHMKDFEGHLEAAVKRNRPIMRKAYENAPAGSEKRGRFAYHMAQDAKAQDDVAGAVDYLIEAKELLPGTNIAVYSLIDQALLCLEQKGFAVDADYAVGELLLKHPEVREGHLLHGTLLAKEGDFYHASMVFDRALAMEPTPLESVREVWFSEGLAKAWAAYAYFSVGRHDDAAKTEHSIPADVREHSKVKSVLSAVQGALIKKTGLEAFNKLLDYYIWDTEAPKALALLDNAPAAFANEPFIGQRTRELEHMLRHLDGWGAYKQCYAELPEEIYHTAAHDREGVLSLYRAQYLLKWAQDLPKDGPPIVVASIGFQDGIIESAVLEANKRIRFVVCDVAPQASKGLADLQRKFGEGRVSSHAVTKHHYDWGDGEYLYDALVIFEVLEHLPDDGTALQSINRLLKPGGELFLSTPVAARWVEPYLTDPARKPAFYGHVRAHNHVTLPALLDDHRFKGTLYEGYDGVFLAHVRKNPEHIGNIFRRSVAIYVPGTPLPFDPFSHEKGFVGGSEECVIHLSEQLAALNFDVTVFTPTPPEPPTVRWHEGVLWRPAEEWDEGTRDYDAVLFWRCPGHVPAEPRRYKKLLWLHDAGYGVDAATYSHADEVLVLSPQHAESLKARDGMDMAPRLVANGIDAGSFPPLTDDPRGPRVIYASSPDRGLERLVDMWPDVLAAVPDAVLDVYYDWSAFETHFPDDARRLWLLIANTRNVNVHGGVSHEQLHAAMRKASVWAYPNSGDVETFCITAVKMCASGCWPVTSGAGALPYILDKCGAPKPPDYDIDSDFGRASFLRRLISALEKAPTHGQRAVLRRGALDAFAWEEVAQRFADVITGGS